MNLEIKWQEVKEKVNVLSFRERIMVCLVALAFVHLVWNGILFSDLFSGDDIIQKKNESLKVNIASVEEKNKEMDTLINLNTVVKLKENIVTLKNKNTEIQKEIVNIAGALVDPKEMVYVLKDLVEKIQGLTVLRIENVGTTPMFKLKKTAEESKGTVVQTAPKVQIYIHSLVIELKGSYFDTLSFIKMVENHNLQVWWDELSYKVIKYPDANIKILLHTLSLEEGFIGA